MFSSCNIFHQVTCGKNETMVTEVFLVGFGHLQHIKIGVFVLFLVTYLATVTGNLLIMTVISVSPRLQSPMYFFICNLSACELCITNSIIPNMLYIVRLNGGFMSFYCCILQNYLGSSTASVECLLLTIMAYDRHLAICNPLRYSSIMNFKTCNHLAAWAWVVGFSVMVVLCITISNLQFCGPNIIDHLFCDLSPLLQLSTSNTYLVDIEVIFATIFLSFVPFVLIVVSYISIFKAILRISSRSGRQKTFSTCSSHLASVCMYCGSLVIIYMVPSQPGVVKINKMFSLLYTVAIPLLNPMIYSLRNQEMMECFRNYLQLINKR